MGIEFEQKFSATPAILDRIRAEIPGEERYFSMETTYYDTCSGSFSAQHCTLRCRMENDICVCTLKTPTGSVGRNEWEVECPGIEEAVELLRQKGAPSEILDLAEQGLQPICGARFSRIAKTIYLADTCLELALDCGMLTGGEREIPLCEVEVELKSGSQSVCVAYANALAAKYQLEPEHRSKFRRALALSRGEENGVF